MIDGLKPYPAYKDSGVPWLGEVPEHWEVRRLKQTFRKIVGGSTPTSGESSFWDGDVIWVTPADVSRSERLRTSLRRITRDGLLSCSSELVPSGSIVVTSRAPVGNVAIAETELCTNQGCKALVATPGVVDSTFAFNVLTSLKNELQSLATGTTFTEIATSRLGNVEFPLPPLPEQAAIVRFLDHADRRIRRYIRAKQKLIKLLEEQKQATVHRAVTRGLNPNVRLKPSGVEWLGNVPEHWEVLRLKDVARVQTGLTLGKAYLGSSTKSYPYLRVANVQVGRVDLRHVKHLDVPEREAAGAMLRAGDVLMTEGGDIDKLGRGCVWNAEIPVCLHQNHVFAVRCDRALLLPEFLVGLMASQHGRTYFQLTAKQTTNLAATNSTTLRAFPILRPPIVEQQAIIDDIARQTVAVSKAVEDAQREISLLREYRIRLIAEVVTGKLDVREAAARLPQEAEDLEPLDEAEAESDAQDAEASDTGGVAEEAEA